MRYRGYLCLPKATSKSIAELKGNKIIVTREIDIKDYAAYLKYDWQLHNLSQDIETISVDNSKRLYLQKAKEIFIDEFEKSTPNKRVNLFGSNSVFYYLFGHTKDWVSWAKKNCRCIKDFLTCIQGDNLAKTVTIIRYSKTTTDAESQLCKTFGIDEISSKRLISLPLSAITGMVEQKIANEHLPEAEIFLSKVTELAKYDK